MWPVLATEVARRVTKKRHSGNDLHGVAALVAYTGIVVVPVLVALNPAWIRRWTLPMLAVTSMGVYATVPDTEHVRVVMLVVVPVAVLCVLLRLDTPALVSGAIAFVLLWQAVVDSANQAPPIVRAIGCFAALLVLPVVRWLALVTGRGRPPLAVVLGVHGVVAVFASRALVHQSSTALVAGVTGGALVVALLVLYACARPAAAAPA